MASASGSCSVVNIWREKCKHTLKEERIFSVIRHTEPYEKFEAKFVFPNGLLEISLSTSESGPWSTLDDEILVDLYQAQMDVIFKTFPDTKYIKLQCIEKETDDQQELPSTSEGHESATRNAFDLIMGAALTQSTNIPKVPNRKLDL